MSDTSLTKFITVVMPVRNEEKFIAETLGMLLAQDYPADRFEIIVADGMSTDRTREIVSQIALTNPMVMLLDNPGMRSSSGRNIGFKAGRGDYFLVVDGHCQIPDNQLFANVADCFENSDALCLGRPQPLDPPGLSEFQHMVSQARASWFGHGTGSLIYSDYEGYADPTSNGAAYRAEVFQEVGYVDEDFDACEDVEFNYRINQAGLKSFTSPRLTIRYFPRDSFTGLFKQMSRYGAGRFRLARKHPESLGVATMVPPVFVAGLFIIILCMMIAQDFPGLKLLLILYAMYAGLAVFESARITKFQTNIFNLRMPAIFFTIHFSLGSGFLIEALRDLSSIAKSRDVKR
jgi:glycosyltransferase involved in cell wall biosynthesis